MLEITVKDNAIAFRDSFYLNFQRTLRIPDDGKTYAQHQFPWFDLYDEVMSDIKASSELSSVKSIKEMDAEKQLRVQQDDNPIDITDSNLVNYPINNSH